MNVSQILRNEKRLVWILTSLTFLIRLVFVIYFYNTKDFVHTQYIDWGEQFAIGNWVIPQSISSKMVIAPFISILYFLFLKLTPDPVFSFYVYNCLVSALTIPVLFYFGKLLLGSKTGLFLAIWGTVYYEFFRYSPVVLKESTLFLLLPVVILYLLKYVLEANNRKYIVISALAFVLLIHTDERYLFFLPFFILIPVLKKPFNLKKILTPALLWVAVIFIFSTPWLIRNYLVYDHVVILSPRTTAFTKHLWGEDLTTVTISHAEGIVRSKEKFLDQAKQFEKEYGVSPREFGRMETKIRAFINYWQPTYFKAQYIVRGYRPQVWSLKHNLLSLIFYGVFLPFYLIGLIVLVLKRNYLVLFIAFIPFWHSILHSITVSALERYRLPINFIIISIGIWTILYLYDKIKNLLKSRNSNNIE